MTELCDETKWLCDPYTTLMASAWECTNATNYNLFSIMMHIHVFDGLLANKMPVHVPPFLATQYIPHIAE